MTYAQALELSANYARRVYGDGDDAFAFITAYADAVADLPTAEDCPSPRAFDVVRTREGCAHVDCYRPHGASPCDRFCPACMGTLRRRNPVPLVTLQRL